MGSATSARQRRNRRRWGGLSAAATLCVLFLTHIPQANIGVDMTWLSLDKLLHALAYGLLAFTYMMSAQSQVNGLVLTGIVLMLASIAGLDEVTQSFVGRSSSLLDFGADMLGILAVVLGRRLAMSVEQKRQRSGRSSLRG